MFSLGVLSVSGDVGVAVPVVFDYQIQFVAERNFVAASKGRVRGEDWAQGGGVVLVDRAACTWEVKWIRLRTCAVGWVG